MNRTNRFGKAILRTLTIGLMAMGLAVGTSALATKSQPAFAYTPKASGQPGETQVPVAQGASYGAGLPEVTFPQRYVWRSAGYADTQVITVTYRLWKYNAASGTWGLYMTRVSSAQVAPNGIGSWVTAWSTPVPFDHFTVNVEVDWKTTAGSLFGWKTLDYNTKTDYQCLTPASCSVLTSTSVGAFIYFAPPAPKPVATPQPTKAPTQQPVGGSSSLTFTPGTAPDYTALFAGSGRQSDGIKVICSTNCGLIGDWVGLLGRILNNGSDPYSQLNQTGAVGVGFQNAANNPYYGRILY
jgi:hypothetical protein